MKTEQIIEMLRAEEAELWEALKNAKLVFGEHSDAFMRAQVRWVTVSQILIKIYENN